MCNNSIFDDRHPTNAIMSSKYSRNTSAGKSQSAFNMPSVQIFTFVYFKICCIYCRWQKNRRRIRRAALSMRYHGQMASQGGTMRRGNHSLHLTSPTRAGQSVRGQRSNASSGGGGSALRRQPSMTKSLGHSAGTQPPRKHMIAADSRSMRSMTRTRTAPEPKWDTQYVGIIQLANSHFKSCILLCIAQKTKTNKAEF